MRDFFNRYVKIIVDDMLSLKKGDALSVNAEECDLEESKAIASYAIDVTCCNVKIVVTKNGRPEDVIEYDAPKQLTTPMTGVAMVRLKHVGRTYTLPDLSAIKKEDIPFIHKLGHLAQPIQTGVRVVVPWAVIPVYDEDDDVSWEKTEKKFRFPLSDVVLSTEYRKKFLSSCDIKSLHFLGKETDVVFSVPEEKIFYGGLHTLTNGRSFVSGDEFDSLLFLVNKDSADGIAHISTKIFERQCTGVISFKDGVLTEWPHTPEFDFILSFDEDIRRPGMLSMRDAEHVLYLGGASVETLPVIPETEDDIPQNFNRSMYSIKCIFDDVDTVIATNCEGKEVQIVKKSYFIE